MVALVLYYVEKILREGYKIFGLDMSQKTLPDTSKFILCISNWMQISIWYENQSSTKKVQQKWSYDNPRNTVFPLVSPGPQISAAL